MQHRRSQTVGLFVGFAVFIVMLLLPRPEGLSPEAWSTAAVAALMALWWMTEAIPIPATALIPLALFPSLDILPMSDTASAYAQELIFLFMGGFFIAAAMERWGLHRRIALSITRRIGTSPGRLVLGFMVATAFLSMWISNTATTAMMFPIALAIGQMLHPADGDPEAPYPFGIALMLGIGYAASVGGVATLIGTPPNAVMAAAVSDLLDVQIGFMQWMAVGLPLVVVMLPIVWLLLTRVLYPTDALTGDAGSILDREWQKLGRPGSGETRVAVVFVLTVLAWLFRSEKVFGTLTIPGIQSFAPGITDATIAIAAALLLFVLPIDLKKGEFTLDWPSARKIPWGVLLLFGGGLALARGMDQTGLAAWIGGGVAGFSGAPIVIITLLVAALFVFLTEITSNLATTTMAMPVIAGVAAGLGIAPLPLMATVALASSMAFMLPVATPPNAIVFGSGYLTIPQMARAGFWLNLISIGLVSLVGTFLIPLLLT